MNKQEVIQKFDLERAKLELRARCDLAIEVEDDPVILDKIARFIEHTVSSEKFYS